jgi:hypothetical protein
VGVSSIKFPTKIGSHGTETFFVLLSFFELISSTRKKQSGSSKDKEEQSLEAVRQSETPSETLTKQWK